MNKNTPQEMIAVIQAHLDGKKLQFYYEGSKSWEDVCGSPAFSFSDTTYRVKPTPKKVPLTREDFPLDKPVWITSQLKDVEQVIGVDKLGVTTPRSWMPFDRMQNISITFDGGKTWQPCWKEVTE